MIPGEVESYIGVGNTVLRDFQVALAGKRLAAQLAVRQCEVDGCRERRSQLDRKSVV